MNRPLLMAAAFAATTLSALPAAHSQTSSTTTATPMQGLRMPYQRNFWGYVGGSVGRSYYDTECIGTECDDEDVGFKLHAGGTFNEILGLELGYVHLGHAKIAGGERKGQGATAVATLGVPFADRFRIFAKGGGVYSWTSVTGGAPGYATGDERGLDWTYGAGATATLAQNWQLRVDWDRYKMDFAGGTDDVDLLSVGVQYRF